MATVKNVTAAELDAKVLKAPARRVACSSPVVRGDREVARLDGLITDQDLTAVFDRRVR